MSGFWRGRKVLVTGACGFIGSRTLQALAGLGARVTGAVLPGEERRPELAQPGVRVCAADLTRPADCEEACRGQDAVLNFAHEDGSAAFKKSRPAYIFRQNLLITLNLIEAACRCGVERFLVTSSAEVYPCDSPSPTAEWYAFANGMDRLDDGYVWSKRMSEVAARLFAEERGIKIAIARPNNVYGPGDSFEPGRGRVVPTFIRSIVEDANGLTIWGDGEQVRTFLYIDDLVRGVLDLVEKYAVGEPVNLGGCETITIKRLAEKIARLAGRDAAIVCDSSKPAGPAVRIPDLETARRVLGFQPQVPLETGLRLTLKDYLERHAGVYARKT
ncbi:MAG: NAD-dependent epimerase/dehydratase family protein [Bryobacteraceae bacterium]